VAGGEGECGEDVAGLLVRETKFGYFACEKEDNICESRFAIECYFGLCMFRLFYRSYAAS